MRRILCWTVVAILAAAGGLQAQPPGPPADSTRMVIPDSVDLKLDREAFSYPAFARRNPFTPLLGDEAGPRFEDLQLLGVILSSQPGESLALMGIAGAASVRPDSVLVEAGSEPPVGATELRASRSRTNRMRVGDRWGNVRLAVIERNRVLVDVTEFGLTERRELLLRRPDAGGIR